MIRVYTVGVEAPCRDQRRGAYFAPEDEHELMALVNRLRESQLREIVVTGKPAKPLEDKFVNAGGYQMVRLRGAWSLRTNDSYMCRGRVTDDVIWLSRWHEEKE